MGLGSLGSLGNPHLDTNSIQVLWAAPLNGNGGYGGFSWPTSTALPQTAEQAIGLSNLSTHIVPTNPFNSDHSTADTIHIMGQLARQASLSPLVQQATRQAIEDLQGTRDRDYLAAIYYWVKGHVTFQQDEELLAEMGMGEDSEVIKSPEVLLCMPQPKGDCDCFSTLLASMLLAAGFTRVQFVTIAADSSLPDKWSHVYVRAWVPSLGAYLPLDASHGSWPGWEHKEITRIQTWDI